MRWNNLVKVMGVVCGVALGGQAQAAFTATVSPSGALKLTGTSADDKARIVGTGTGTVKVQDVDNGVQLLPPGTPVSSILVIGKQGNNTVTMVGVDISGAIQVRGGNGVDITRIKDSLTASRLTVEPSNGDNKLRVANDDEEGIPVPIDLTFGLSYEGGKHEDIVDLEIAYVGNSTAANVTINTGQGDDIVRVTGLDEIDDFDTDARYLSINTAGGADRIVVRELDTTHGITIASGPGEDFIRVINPVASDDDGFVDVLAGPNDDEVIVREVVAMTLNVNCGSGNNDIATVNGNLTEEEVIVTMCEVDGTSMEEMEEEA